MIRLYSESAYYAGVMTGFCVDFDGFWWILSLRKFIWLAANPSKVYLAGCKSRQSLFGWVQIRAKLLWVAAESTAAIPLAVNPSVWISGLKSRKSRKSAKSTEIHRNPAGIQKCVFADVAYVQRLGATLLLTSSRTHLRGHHSHKHKHENLHQALPETTHIEPQSCSAELYPGEGHLH